MSQAPPAERASAREAPHPDRRGLPATAHDSWTGLREALNAEWTKVRTVAGTGWLLLAVIAVTVAVGAGASAATSCPPGTACPVDTTKLSLTGIQAGQAVVAILAVLAISSEYSTGMIRTTLTAMPRRATLLGTKAAILTGLVLVFGAIAVAGSLLAGRLILPGHWPWLACSASGSPPPSAIRAPPSVSSSPCSTSSRSSRRWSTRSGTATSSRSGR